jgi:hypothetical protein
MGCGADQGRDEVTEQEMQAAVNQLVRDMLAKGLRKPEARVWIKGNELPQVSMSAGKYGDDDYWYEYITKYKC